MRFLPTLSSKTPRALLAVTALASGHVLQAQENPVQSLSESAPGFSLPSTSESAALERELQLSEDLSTTPTSTADAPVAWWEGMEEIAIDSMNTKNYTLGIKLTTGYDYDDNVYLTDPDAIESSSLFARAATNYSYSWAKTKLSLNYLPEYRWYDAKEVDETFNQLAFANLDYSGSKGKFGVDVRFSDSEGGNVEVGERVSSQLFSVALSGAYSVSLKTIIGGSAGYYKDDYKFLNDREKLIADIYADYKITTKTFLGVGAQYERMDLAVGPDSDAYSGFGRISWQMSQKLSFRGKAGVEYREYDSGTEQTGGVFALGLFFSPSVKNSLSLDLYRNSSPSLGNANQSIYNTGVAATFNQEILSMMKFRLTGGYNNSSYETVTAVDTVTPDSDYWFIRPQLVITVLGNGEILAYYQYSTSDGGTEFDRNLVGMAFSYNF